MNNYRESGFFESWQKLSTFTRTVVQIVLMVGSLVVLFGPTLSEHMSNSAKPQWLADDARVYVWPYFRYRDDRLFQDDYVAEYYLAGAPTAYRYLFSATAQFCDPRTLSKIIPYIGLLVLVVTVGLSANQLGGKVAAWAAMAFVLSSGEYLYHITGGLPRSFGLPFISAGFAALVLGRPYWLASLTVASSAFYFSTGVILGFSLAGLLLLVPARDRGLAWAWSLRKRLTVVAITAILSVLVVIPVAVQLHPYGKLLGSNDIATYPEMGLGGRFSAHNHPPYESFHTTAFKSAMAAFVSHERPWSWRLQNWFNNLPDRLQHFLRLNTLLSLGLIGIVGYWLQVKKDASARRVMILLGSALFGNVLAHAFAPHLHLPTRYVWYTVPIIVTVVFPSAVNTLMEKLSHRMGKSWIRPLFVLIVCSCYLVTLGARGPTETGLNVQINSNEHLYEYLQLLPADSMIAGWPQGRLDNVPYQSQRRVLINYEGHSGFHEGFVIEMRQRMMALIDAYFAIDSDPLVRLRDKFGVTHLLVDVTHYKSDPPTYFLPFDSWVRSLRSALANQQPETLRQIPHAAIFSEGDLVLLDLSRLKIDIQHPSKP